MINFSYYNKVNESTLKAKLSINNMPRNSTRLYSTNIMNE